MLSPLVLLAAIVAAPGTDSASEEFFELRIRPVLVQRCFKCHGGEEVNDNLRVDSREALLTGGDAGAAIVPGKPEESLLVEAIRQTNPDRQMPPDGKLPDEAIADFARWIEAGAAWPGKPLSAAASDADARRARAVATHWSFQPLRSVAPPTDPNGWAQHPIDRFIAAGHRERGLLPVGPAAKRTLLRRASFDLVGLPPTPEETESFLLDDSPDAFERLVDRLLASPRYGERWGRHWLDVVRYADTAGDNADYPIPEARHYRDYVIDAFNADLPFDQFVREQLAGDLLARAAPRERYSQSIAATGYLALARRYATAPYEFWHLTLEDAIDTVGQSFLGLSLKCARCHDHKFDPIPTADYYGLYGIFDSTQFPWAGGEEFSSKKLNRLALVPLVPPSEAEPKLVAWARRREAAEAEVAQLEKSGPLAEELAVLTKQVGELEEQIKSAGDQGATGAELRTQLAGVVKQRDEAQQRLKQALAKLRDSIHGEQRAGLPADLPGAYAVSERAPVDAAIQLRGNPETKGPVVPRRVPAFLPSLASPAIPPDASGRLELALWLTRPDHPLVARVAVNRLWQHHFGQGLVATPNNFGVRGAPPTHPELLDYLAGELIAGGWSVKAMHRLILSSRTWQLASTGDASNLARDPDNRGYWRYPRRRLEAEAIRDAMLAVGGRLDLARPGEHPFPPIATWSWTQHNQFKAIFPSAHRSVYLMTPRLQRHPFLALFDGPDTNTSTGQRTSATVPLQSLYLMNGPEVREYAQAFAVRLLAAARDADERLRLAHRLALAREPEADELTRARQFVLDYSSKLGEGGAADEPERAAWTSYARVLLTSNEFFYVD